MPIFVKKSEQMSAIDIRASIASILENTTDEETLDAYYQILLNLIRVQNRVTVAYDTDDKPLTLQHLRHQAESASSRVRSGASIKHDKAKKQAENW